MKDLTDKEDDMEAIRQALQARGYYLNFYFMYIEEEAFSTLNLDRSNWYFGRKTLSDNPVIVYGEFRLDESFEFYKYEWRYDRSAET